MKCSDLLKNPNPEAMHNFPVYLIETYVYLGIFALTFALLHKKLSNAVANRYIILASMGLAITLPLLPFSFSAGETASGSAIYDVVLSPVVVGASTVVDQSPMAANGTHWSIYMYSAGVSIFMLILLYRIGNTLRIIARSKRTRMQNLTLCEVDQPNIASSFFHWVIISKSCRTSHRNWIIQHESAHAKGLHSLDLIFGELVCALCWLHPGAWFLRRVMKENHEYLADAATLADSNDKHSYCEVLLAEAMGTDRLVLQHPFAGKAAIQKRIERLTPGAKKASYRPYFMLIPALALAVVIHGCTEEVEEPSSAVKEKQGIEELHNRIIEMKENGNVYIYTAGNETDTDGQNVDTEEVLKLIDQIFESEDFNLAPGFDREEVIKDIRESIRTGEMKLNLPKQTFRSVEKDKDGVYTSVEQMPEFPGGPDAMTKYLLDKLKHSGIEKTDGAHGMVVVSYTISARGYVEDIKIAETSENVDPSLEAKALSIVRSMPRWTPGKQDGKNVAVRYTLPIIFTKN